MQTSSHLFMQVGILVYAPDNIQLLLSKFPLVKTVLC